ncbi:MAG TPA: hypothetical protein DIC60_06165 [Lachnospiraceae bacterium]|nr:hypothetical protein [Lachnospiraceae bacterium]
MKIEKLSDTQIKLTLSRADLKERNLSIEELIKPSEKTQELFRRIMEQAFNECGFSFENTPLMVEAAPVSVDGLMIIVTKLPDKETKKEKVSLVYQNKDLHRYKKKSIAHYIPEHSSDEEICIYSFNTIDIVTDVALRLYPIFNGFSELYKYNKRYFLLLQNDTSDDNIATDKIELILSEYGEKHISTVLSKYHLIEHGERLMKNPAVKTLKHIFE